MLEDIERAVVHGIKLSLPGLSSLYSVATYYKASWLKKITIYHYNLTICNRYRQSEAVGMRHV